jgi:hypothetical protein
MLLAGRADAVGSWTKLNQTNGNNLGHMLLLTDGTVMVQNGTNAGWYRLIPDNTGSYVNGSWSNMASMSFGRQFYSSDVLQDGRVFIAGGEHPSDGNQGTNATIYDPWTNGWSSVPSEGVGFDDAVSVLLPNGDVLEGPVAWGPFPQWVTVIYDPTTDSWLPNPPSSMAYQEEVSWVKLPDNSILTIDFNAQTSERFIPSLGIWISDASMTVNTWGNKEMGAAFLLPNSNAFYLGGSGHTAIYTPSGTTNNGSWAAGPDIGGGMVASDAPAAMMVNGKILCAVGSSSQVGGSPAPTWFYEYDYTQSGTNAWSATSSPGNPTIGSSDNTMAAYLSMLDLPDGTVLLSDMLDESGTLYVYRPDTVALAAGKPAITSITQNLDGSYHLLGTGLNGISQGAGFGDDAQMDSNYPLVRLTDGSSNVFYGRTYNWSSTGVMTGSAPVTTEFKVSLNERAAYSLVVVANGIASDPVTFYGPVWVDFNYDGIYQLGDFTLPYETLAGGVSNVPSGGTIAINGSVQPSTSSETLTISTPMTITAFSGPSTIGR